MIIGLLGYRGSGKSSAAKFLSYKYSFELVKYAGPLKKMVSALLSDVGVDPKKIERMIEGDLKEESVDILNGYSPRYVMQTLGTEWARTYLGETFWQNIFKHRVQHLVDLGRSVVCDDVRFANEAKALKNMGGYLIKIEGRLPHGGDRHPSEDLDWATPDNVDYVIDNSGTMFDLENKIDDVFYKIWEELYGSGTQIKL